MVLESLCLLRTMHMLHDNGSGGGSLVQRLAYILLLPMQISNTRMLLQYGLLVPLCHPLGTEAGHGLRRKCRRRAEGKSLGLRAL